MYSNRYRRAAKPCFIRTGRLPKLQFSLGIEDGQVWLFSPIRPSKGFLPLELSQEVSIHGYSLPVLFF